MTNNNTSGSSSNGSAEDTASSSITSTSSLNEPLLSPSPQLQEDEEEEGGGGDGAIIETSVSTITDDDDDDVNSNHHELDLDDEENGLSFYSSINDYYEEFTSIRRRRRRRRSSSSDDEGNSHCGCCSCGKLLRSFIVVIVFFIIFLWIISIWFKPEAGSLDRLPTFLFPTFLFPTIHGGGDNIPPDNNDIHVADSPTQIHLSYTSDPSVVLVQFTTAVAKHPRITPVAMYGIDEPTTKVDDGTTTTYEASDMCTGPANTSADSSSVVGQLHSIALTNLQPSTYYNYKVGLTFGQGIVWSSLGSFPSPPTIGSSVNYTYVVYGAGSNANLQDLTFESEVKSIHHLGNFVNASGDNTKWESWMTAVGDKFASQIPIQIVVGNQDYDYTLASKKETTTKDPSGVNRPYHPTWGNFNISTNSGGECGVPLNKRFTMPSGTQQSNGVFWYSYKFAAVHTIVLSTEHSLEVNSTQQQFLLSSLKQVNRTITPWLIVEMHRSLYYPYNNTSDGGGKDYDVGLHLRSQLEKVFVDGEVDLVLSGHAKSYSRSCQNLFEEYCGGPFYNNGTGPMYITVGGTGSGSSSSINSGGEESIYYADDVDDDDEIYIENNFTEKTIKSPTNGYGRITVNSTNLLFEYVVQQGGGADSNNNTVLDEVVMITRRR